MPCNLWRFSDIAIVPLTLAVILIKHFEITILIALFGWIMVHLDVDVAVVDLSAIACRAFFSMLIFNFVMDDEMKEWREGNNNRWCNLLLTYF